MAETTIAASVEVDFKSIKDLKVALEESEKAVNELSDEFKKAEDKYKKMIDEFGDGSKEAIAAQKQMLQMQEQLNAQTQKYTTIQDEANRRTEEYNQKVDNAAATVSALNATVGGLQGALELTGLASEETEQALSKITAALAIGDAIQNLAEFGTAIKATFGMLKTQIMSSSIMMKANAAATGLASRAMALFGVTVNTTSTAFKVLKGAIISTGVGALVIAIGFVVEKLMEWASQSSENEQAIESMDKATKKLNSSLDNQIAILEAIGGKEREIYQLRQQQANNELNTLRKTYAIRAKEGKKLTEEEAARFEELKTQIRVNEINENNRLRKIREDEEKKKKDEREKIRQKQEQEYEKEKQKREQKAEQERQKAEQEEKAGADKLAEINEALIKRRMTAREIELYDLKKNYEEQKKILEAGEKSTTEATELYLKQRADIEKKYLDERLQKEKDYRELLNSIIAESEGPGGKTEAEIERQKIEDAFDKRREELEKQHPKETTLIIALENARQFALNKFDEEQRQKQLRKQEAKFQKDAANTDLSLKDRIAALKGQLDLANDLEFESEDERKEYKEKIEKEITKQTEDELDKRVAKFNEYASATLGVISTLKQANDTDLNIKKEQYNQDLANLQQMLDNKEISQEQFEAKRKELDAKQNEELKKSFKRNQILSIAEALINTATAVTNALKLPFPLNFIQAAAVGVLGGLQVKMISKQKPEQISTVSPVISATGGGGTAPIEAGMSAALQGQALNAEAINALGNNAMRAYVLNSDIQNNSQRNAYLQRNARIG